MSLCPSIITSTKDSDNLAKQLLFWAVDLPSAAGLKQELVQWKPLWNDSRHETKPEDLLNVLPYADEDIFQTFIN